MDRILIKDGWYSFIPHFYLEEIAQNYYNLLLSKLNWTQGTISIFGKTHAVPRFEAFYAENNQKYSYSGQLMETNQFNQLLLDIKNDIEKRSNQIFNSVLANYYRNGFDSNGWHADNEKELGLNPIIASISFGATRRFDLKHNESLEKISFELNSGSLLLMGGSIQHHWKHCIAKQTKIKHGRINLTFRKIL